VFTDRASAGTAAEALRRRGFADDDVTTAVWSGDRYVIESHAGRMLERGLLSGIFAGTITGAALGALVALAIWGTDVGATALGLSVLFVGTTGATVGAYIGMGRYRPQLETQRQWSHLSLAPNQVLLVVAIEDEPAEAAAVLEDHGGRRVEPTSD
jgi:hypothetical protein